MRQTIEVDVLSTTEATVVEVKGSTYREANRGHIKSQGFAKKHPKDSHDPEVGHSLAMARALRDLAEAYETRAWERINHPLQTVTYAKGGIFPSGIDPKYSVTFTGTPVTDTEKFWRDLGRAGS
jgi:hypothetical protein